MQISFTSELLVGAKHVPQNIEPMCIAETISSAQALYFLAVCSCGTSDSPITESTE